MLQSVTCRQEHFRSEWYQRFARQMGFADAQVLHRKHWEFCAIAQALVERGRLHSGRKSLGFAVGREPLVSLFASFGVQVEATDPMRRCGWIPRSTRPAQTTFMIPQ